MEQVPDYKSLENTNIYVYYAQLQKAARYLKAKTHIYI